MASRSTQNRDRLLGPFQEYHAAFTHLHLSVKVGSRRRERAALSRIPELISASKMILFHRLPLTMSSDELAEKAGCTDCWQIAQRTVRLGWPVMLAEQACCRSDLDNTLHSSINSM